MPKTNKTINPATEDVIHTYEMISDEDAHAIVDACHQAFLSWRHELISTRAKIVRRIGELLRERDDPLSALMTQEMGKPISQSHQEVDLCASICDYSADHAGDVLVDEERRLEGGRSLVTYQPIGVILGAQPWNFPLYQVVRYSISNLMAGNGVLLKHAPNVWGSALAIETLYRDAGLPENLFRALLIDADQFDALIAHEHVRGVTFTGSPEAGSKVAAEAGRHLKKSMLELGSNDAYLVLDDADIDKAAKVGVQGRIYNTGETCVAAKRFIVVDAVYDRFREAFLEEMRKVEYGDPTQEKTQMGPIARRDLLDKLHKGVTESIEKGATCSLGGTLPDGKGYFYPATVLEDVRPGMPAYDEELFGPAASLIRVRDEEEAIRVANDSRYGLGGGIFSRDEKHAIEIARDLFDTGMVNINGYRVAQPQLPFGGVKDSGYGREHGGFGMKEFVNAKSVLVMT